MVRSTLSALSLLCLGLAQPACSQIAVSANDGKQHAADQPDEPRGPDSVVVLDLAASPPRILARLAAPASMIGPPASVALSTRAGIALVSSAQRIESGAAVPDDRVSVIDIARPRAARVTQTVRAGANASGVAINPAGSLALVTNAGSDSVSVFSIKNRSLTPAGTVALPAKSKPLDIAFCCDGQSAYVVLQGANALAKLELGGGKAAVAEPHIAVGVQPYSMAVNRRTGLAYVSNLGGRSGAGAASKTGTIAIVDLRAGKLLNEVDAGPTPENLVLSPSGRFLEVTLINGSNASSRAPNYHDHGMMRIFAVQGASLTLVAETPTSRWCQGAAWSKDEARITLQCGDPKQLETYRFDGRAISRDEAAIVPLEARPAAIATAASR